jgi:hypothetical protein
VQNSRSVACYPLNDAISKDLADSKQYQKEQMLKSSTVGTSAWKKLKLSAGEGSSNPLAETSTKFPERSYRFFVRFGGDCLKLQASRGMCGGDRLILPLGFAGQENPQRIDPQRRAERNIRE